MSNLMYDKKHIQNFQSKFGKKKRFQQGLAETVLTGEAKVIAKAAAGVDADWAAETNWKHSHPRLGWLNYIQYKAWDEITYPSLNFNSCTWD